MATLKSPRNNRKKKEWSAQFRARSARQNISLFEHRTPRSHHQMQLFLRDSSHWVVSQPALSTKPYFWLPEFVEGRKPPVRIKYGRKTFDSTRPYPLVFRDHFRSKEACERFSLLINADAVVGSSETK